MRLRFVTIIVGVFALAAAAQSAAAPLRVHWMRGVASPGTPSKYDKVGVLKIGPSSAKNVLVLEPGTSAGSAYFVPLAQWIVKTLPGWQVWSVERRENLLEDQSMLDKAKDGTATSQEVFNYYLGWLTDSSVTTHIQPPADASVGFARDWGLNVAIGDLSKVIAAARKLGGKVVLGGHSLGGAVVTAYATWNFAGKSGADQLAGLVFDDGAGGGFGPPVTAGDARQELQTLSAGTPWLAFSGVPAPYLGLYAATGSTGALTNPNDPAIGQTFSLLPSTLKPPPGVTATNLALFAYDTNVGTSQLSFASQAHLGQLAASGDPRGWDRDGAITPVARWATMLSGYGVRGADGSEWYFPQRLTDDTGVVGNGLANPAQKVLDVHSTLGRHLPHSLKMYAFGAFGGSAITDAVAKLAQQSGIPRSNLTLANYHSTYAHNDPAAAYPKNAFFTRLVRFLKRIAPPVPAGR